MNPTQPGGGAFAATQWTVVLAAGRTDSPEARAALASLCGIYWYPLYAFVRRQGHSAHDAQDLTQGFFAVLLEKNYVGDVDRTKGKFRSFLLASLKHFMANEWDKANALKRGGGRTFVPIDTTASESRFGVEPASSEMPDRTFERQWALALLDRVLARLRSEFEVTGKVTLFDELKETLSGERGGARYADIGQRLAMSEGAVKVAVHRMRHRYRELLRAEIANTVEDPAEVDEELRHLITALG